METDFQTAKLGHLDFDTEMRKGIGSIPLPDEIPAKADYSHLPKDILKTTTVENLISQNEDLMARLKVALRRLSILETENQKVIEESNKARISQSSTHDQILVFKEKDTLWRKKVDALEREKEVYTEKMKALQERMQNMASELSRHVKYHERIKNQVKPYISQLKEYSRTQDLRVQELEKDALQKEAQLRDLRHQVIEVTKNSRYQVETQEKKSREMVEYYEAQLQAMKKDLKILNEVQEDLEMKSLKLHKALERQDALENEVITLRRSKEELKKRFESEMKAQQERMSELSRQNQKLGVEHADLQVRTLQDQELIKKLEKENFQNLEQLEGLRYMWNAKNEENDKLKTAIGALERLNLELSQKLNELRKEGN